jgi:hypothetical protein
MSELDRVRASLRERGGRLGFIAWGVAGEGIVGAATDASLAALSRAGVQWKQLFTTIAEYEDARVGGDRRAVELPGPPEIRYALVVAVVDLAVSPNAERSVDPEQIIRRNGRYLAILDAERIGSSTEALIARYRASGLRLADAVPLDAFPSRSGWYFPENPVTPGEVAGKTSAFEGAYTSYDELTEGLRRLEAHYPSLVRLESLGRSYEGRDIWAVKISARTAVDDSAKPDVLVTGCYHAREWIALEVPYALASRLPELYETDPRVRHILDTTEVWVVPVVNPDGLVFSQQRGNHQADDVRFWRKNRRPIDLDDDGVPEGLGVDLNRNHDFAWRLPGDQPYPNVYDDLGASDNPSNFQLYRGPEPSSEPEVRAIESLTASPSHQFTARLDYHNYSELLLYPDGHSSVPTPDDALFKDLGGLLSGAIAESRGTRYRLLQAIDFYTTTGTSLDYAYGHDRQVAYTVEVSPSTCCFDLDESLIPAVIADNLPGAVAFLDWAAGPATVASVRVTQGDTVLYATHWERGQGARVLTFDARGDAEAGPARVEVTFSRPLLEAPQLAVVANGAASPLAPRRGDPARYDGDSWVADVTLPLAGASDPVRLRVAASVPSAGSAGFDANPSTVAAYLVGTGLWRGREAGADSAYVILNSTEDFPPSAGFVAPGSEPPSADGLPVEVFLAGRPLDVAWVVSDDRGLASQTLDFSTDGGATFSPVAGLDLAPSARSAVWNVPARLASAGVVLRLTASDGVNASVHALSRYAFAVSRVSIVKEPGYGKGRLRIATRKGSVTPSSDVRIEIDGRAVAPARVRAKADRVIVRGSLGDLGLATGRESRVRLVVDGVPAPTVAFTP